MKVLATHEHNFSIGRCDAHCGHPLPGFEEAQFPKDISFRQLTDRFAARSHMQMAREEDIQAVRCLALDYHGVPALIAFDLTEYRKRRELSRMHLFDHTARPG